MHSLTDSLVELELYTVIIIFYWSVRDLSAIAKKDRKGGGQWTIQYIYKYIIPII